MKCILCNDRNGSTRCEGCQQLYCLPCMNKHHEELVQQFQLVVDVRNELKELLDITELTSKNDKEIPCIVEIDLWEQKIIDRIRNIAAKARISVKDVLEKNMAEVRYRFEQLSVDVQQRQKEGKYLENDIDSIKSQLEQLRNDVEDVTKKIHVNTTISQNIEWDTLIYVTEEDLSGEATSKIIQANSYSTQKNTTVSSMTASSKQVAAEQQQNFVRIPCQYKEADPPSNLVDFEQKTDRIRPCIVCKHYFNDLLAIGICPDCDYKLKQRPPRYVSIVRAPLPNIYPPLHRNSDFTTPLSSSRDRGPQKLVCPHCKNLNLVNSAQNGRDYTCSICQTILHAPDYKQ